MRSLITLGTSFLSGLAGCFSVMLLLDLFQPHSIKPWAAVGAAAAVTVATEIRGRPSSTNQTAWLIASLIIVSVAIGVWLSGLG